MIITSETDLRYDFLGRVLVEPADKVRLTSPDGERAVVPVRAITAVHVREDIRQGLEAYTAWWEEVVRARYGNYSYKEQHSLPITAECYRVLQKLGVPVHRYAALDGSTLRFWAEYGLSAACRCAGIPREELALRHTYHKGRPALRYGGRVFVPDPEHPEGGWWEEEKSHEEPGSAVQTG